MSGVRVLVGTRKGAFILTSDEKREKWEVDGPQFAGWEMYHLKGSPADPNRIYASQTSGWFGQIIQRSDDGGKTWFQPGLAPGEPTTSSSRPGTTSGRSRSSRSCSITRVSPRRRWWPRPTRHVDRSFNFLHRAPGIVGGTSLDTLFKFAGWAPNDYLFRQFFPRIRT